MSTLGPIALPQRAKTFIAKSPALSYTSKGEEFNYVAANWANRTIVLQVSIRTTSGTAYARLYDDTAAAVVTGSSLSTENNTMTRLRTGGLTLVDGHNYHAQVGPTGGNTKTLGGRLVIT